MPLCAEPDFRDAAVAFLLALRSAEPALRPGRQYLREISADG